MSDQGAPADSGVEDLVARPGGVSYLRIPARDIPQSAEFYHAVFGWQLRGPPDVPSFSDGTVDVLPAVNGGDSCRTAHAAPRWVPASPGTAAITGGLTLPPQAFSLSARPAARMFRAALTSRS